MPAKKEVTPGAPPKKASKKIKEAVDADSARPKMSAKRTQEVVEDEVVVDEEDEEGERPRRSCRKIKQAPKDDEDESDCIQLGRKIFLLFLL